GIDLGNSIRNSQDLVYDDRNEAIISEDISHLNHSHFQTYGTWLGITKSSRFSFITNFREHPSQTDSHAQSRGFIVRDFLLGKSTKGKKWPQEFTENLVGKSAEYNGFNVVVGEVGGETWYLGNRGDAALEKGRKIEDGIIYGLSNDILKEEGQIGWPKVEKGKRMVSDAISKVSVSLL
ncbi:hypothetical protein HK096_000044, partial [Nowakowskiella sp. JEL0078]